jgi:hypothetical protein
LPGVEFKIHSGALPFWKPFSKPYTEQRQRNATANFRPQFHAFVSLTPPDIFGLPFQVVLPPFVMRP